MPDSIIVAMSTCPDEQSAQRISAALVSERLATCINRVGGVRSTYVWEGRLQDDAEILLIMKTTSARLALLDARLRELHPYEMPELVAFRVDGGNVAYLDWVRRGVETEGGAGERR